MVAAWKSIDRDSVPVAAPSVLIQNFRALNLLPVVTPQRSPYAGSRSVPGATCAVLIRTVCADPARVRCALFSKPNGSHRGGSSCRWLSPCDYGRHRSAARPLLRQQHALLAGLAGPIRHRRGRTGEGRGDCQARQDGAAPRCSPSSSPEGLSWTMHPGRQYTFNVRIWRSLIGRLVSVQLRFSR